MGKDRVSTVDVVQCLEVDITGDGTSTGAIIDMSGVTSAYFALGVHTWVDGTYTLKLEEGDESDLSDAAEITNIVFADAADLAAALTDGDSLARQGVYGTKRYVRASVVASSVTSGGSAYVVAVLEKSVAPVAQG